MKTAAFWISTFAVFGVVNAMIAAKEATLRNGVTMYLELAPVDPRSLMQGDYMALDYELERNAMRSGPPKNRGAVVVTLDEQKVAHFVRFHQGEPLAPGEHLLRYRVTRNGLTIGSNAFFFQEGHGDHYAGARYGEYKVDPSGTCLLVGLRNPDFSRAGPPEGQ